MRVSAKAAINHGSPSTAQKPIQALLIVNFHLDSHLEGQVGHHHISLQTDQRTLSDLSKKGGESLVVPDSMKATLMAACSATIEETPAGLLWKT